MHTYLLREPRQLLEGAARQNIKAIFKNYAPFVDCISGPALDNNICVNFDENTTTYSFKFKAKITV